MPPQKGTERYRLWKESIDEAAAKRRGVPLSKDHCNKISVSNTGRIKSQEECDNISKGLKDKPKSPEHRKHISESLVGNPSPRKNVKLSEDTKNKIRVSHIGIYPSDETRKKRSLSLMGNTNKLGYVTPKETRDKMRASAHKGPDHHNWKDGITKIEKAIRRLPEYSEWVESVFIRDDYTCKDCKKRGGNLNAHHIDEFSEIIKRNKIKTIPEALQCEELWNIDNGITLCVKCHKKKTRKRKTQKV